MATFFEFLNSMILLWCLIWCGYHAVDTAAVLVPWSTADRVDHDVHPIIHHTDTAVLHDHEMQPTVKYLGDYKTLTIWQIPSTPVRKVLFIAVGSGVRPWDYWDRSPRCTLCTGLPEMRRIVLDALSHSYAVILVSPMNEGHAWNAWPPNSTDLTNAVSILRAWKHRYGFRKTPTIALGSSAGGHALSTLGLIGPPLFESMVLMVSKGIREAWHEVRRDYPPTLFVHCPRDRRSKDDIVRTIEELRNHGGQAGDVRWRPHPITGTWFSELIPRLSPAESVAIYEALKDDGTILDEQDYLLNAVVDWQPVLRKRNVLAEDPEIPGQLVHAAAINQELRVAYAMHATISRKDEEIFTWFEGDYSIDKLQTSSTVL